MLSLCEKLHTFRNYHQQSDARFTKLILKYPERGKDGEINYFLDLKHETYTATYNYVVPRVSIF